MKILKIVDANLEINFIKLVSLKNEIFYKFFFKNSSSLGSSWHPYLPPNGYDTCAVCTCDSNTLEITCPRIQCPPLTCSEKVAYRPDKKACCKRCPDVSLKVIRKKIKKLKI